MRLRWSRRPIAEGLMAWVSGQPTVAAGVKRTAGIQGAIDHFGATSFLAGLLTILRDSGYAGLVLVLDEVETLQRMRGDTRDKGLNALRQWLDEIDAGRFPGLYLLVTGTPAFFAGSRPPDFAKAVSTPACRSGPFAGSRLAGRDLYANQSTILTAADDATWRAVQLDT
jgi:hypothetical protein